VVAQVYSFFYISEYAFFFIILAMAYSLLSKFVDVQKAFEELNDGLERKVQERTKENEKLQAKLLQSEKMAAVGQLAGGVAHEINNPMTVILGYAQLILKKINSEDQISKPLLAIEKEARRCKILIDNLLTFSRSSKLSKRFLSINGIIKEAVSLVEVQEKIMNVDFIANYGENLPETMLDSNQIQQLVINMCNNAVDAMSEGGTIKIETARESNFIIITISDTGMGISEGNKKKLFEPFFTTKEVGKGTGLGLSICYEIVKKHNGEISVESEIGKGSMFIIRLPIVTE
jgi:two-component system NtrC family sensor kinase